MTTYSVHLPAEAVPGSTEGLERAILVKDGFHWTALVFPLLWLLFNRLWWAFLAFVVITMAVVFLGRAAGLSETAIATLDLLIGLFVAISAPDLKAWGLGRRGYAIADVVTGSSADDAERRFFDRWLSRTVAAPGARLAGQDPAQGYASRAQPQVLGLFPDSGAAR